MAVFAAVVAAVVAAVATMILSACGTDAGGVAAADSRIATHPDGDGGDASYVRGRLELQHGCLYLVETEEPIGRRWVPALPSGQAHIAGKDLVYRGHRYPLGSEVQIAGSGLPTTGREGFTVPESCDAEVPLWNGWGAILDVDGR